MRTKFIYLFLLLSFNCCLFAQNPQAYIDTFFMKYEKEGIVNSVNYLFSTNELLDLTNNNLEEIASNLEKQLVSLGKYCGHELIIKRKLGECLEQYSFIAKYEKQPIRFNFIFYKALDKWSLQSFNYDDELLNELDESSKIIYLELSDR